MANYLVTDPQGVRYKVTAPDDATPEQVQTYAQQNMGGGVPAETRSLGQEAVRQAGLGARMVAEGVSSFPTFIGDSANKLLNLIPGIKLGMPSQMVHEALTKAGLPLPESTQEEYAGMVGGAVAGQGGIIKAAKALPEAYAAIKGMLTSNAGAQGVSAAGAGAGGELARQNDMGPMGQLVASLAGGVVTPVTMLALQQIAKAAGRGVANLSAPFTEAGQQKVVGNTLDRFASNPTQARANLQDVPEYVEGSTPTSAQAARDPGLIQLERTLANKDSQFATRESQNNAARGKALADVAQTPADLEAARGARAGAAKPLYDAAMGEQPRFTADTHDTLKDLLARPSFRKALQAAEQDVADEGLTVDRAKPSGTPVPARAQVKPTANPNVDDIEMAVRKLGGINPADERVGSLSKGMPFGANPAGPVWRNPVHGQTGNTQAGHSVDQMAQKLYERGYLDRPDDLDGMMDKLADHYTGHDQHYSNIRDIGVDQVDPHTAVMDRLAAALEQKNGPKTPATPDLTGENGVRLAHATKLRLDDMISEAQRAGRGNEARNLGAIQEKLLGMMEGPDFAPSYQQARSTYREMSGPVNQMETAQAIQQKTAKMGPDVTGDARISQAKWQTNVTNKIAELGKTLTPEQVDTMKRIGQDLDRASLSETAGRAVGSNTTQNLSSANLLGQVVGNKVAKSPLLQSVLARPLNWLYKIPEAQIQDLLTQAMLDPMTARVMLTKATPANIEMMGGLLRDRARAMALAGSTQSSVGTEQAQQ